VRDEGVAPHLDRHVGVAPADLLERRGEVVAPGDVEGVVEDLARPAGRSSTSDTSPTCTSSTLDWPWSPKMPPNRTRNISGKISAKNTEALSRRKPLMMARESARKVAVVAGIRLGTPAR
jgi:hypothetical protein